MRKLLVMVSLFAVLALCSSGPAMAATYDLAADFSATENPNGVWSYGWTQSRGSTFQLATTSGEGSHPEGTLKGWIPYEGIMSPAYAVTDWDAQTHFIPAGTVALHPGSLCENSVVRWTAPSAGTYTIQGWFDGNDFSHPTSTDVAIRHGTPEIFTGAINSYNVPLNFSLTRQLNAGDTIDFAVGCGSNGNYFGDSTGISATIIGPTDDTPPVITRNVSGTEGQNGWYTSDVTVDWTVSDPESPNSLQTTGCVDQNITNDQAATTYSCSATSAGGSAGPETVSIKRDATAPDVTLGGVSGTSDTNGWYKSVVTQTFNASDALSDLAGPASFTKSSGANEEGSNVNIGSGPVADNAGNTASASAGPFKIDLSDPTNVQFSGGPAAGGSYYFGSVPNAPTCTADDAVSGFASCNVTGYSTAVGTHTMMTATATDNAGRTATATRTYTVNPWTMKGFYQPVDMNGVYNTVKGGSTVPFKFEVFAGNTELTDVATTIGSSSDVKQTKITCDGTAVEDAIEATTTGGTSLRYDTTAGQFVFNWQTPKAAGSCYKVMIPAKDGSSLTAYFKLK